MEAVLRGHTIIQRSGGQVGYRGVTPSRNPQRLRERVRKTGLGSAFFTEMWLNDGGRTSIFGNTFTVWKLCWDVPSAMLSAALHTQVLGNFVWLKPSPSKGPRATWPRRRTHEAAVCTPHKRLHNNSSFGKSRCRICGVHDDWRPWTG